MVPVLHGGASHFYHFMPIPEGRQLLPFYVNFRLVAFTDLPLENMLEKSARVERRSGAEFRAPAARELLPFYAGSAQRCTFTILRQNQLTFTEPSPYGIPTPIMGAGLFSRKSGVVFT
jgi:hypothetical protein